MLHSRDDGRGEVARLRCATPLDQLIGETKATSEEAMTEDTSIVFESCDSDPVLATLLASALQAQPKLIARARLLVEAESPSKDKSAVDRVVDVFADWCKASACTVAIHSHREFGNSLEATFGPNDTGQEPILILGHLDTVWEQGTLSQMPWRQDEKTIWGPGALDMKVGAVMALSALEILHHFDRLMTPVILLLHGDEEVGSPVSRSLTEEVARRCQTVYVLEPGQGIGGAYKTARKGVGRYRLEVSGVAAHAGVDFDKGQSAVIELARQVEYLSNLSDVATGLTINVGVVGGGTQSNVVADRAWADIDVRMKSMNEAESIDAKLKAINSFNARCKVHLTGGLNRPPMVRSSGTSELFNRARRLALQMGLDPLEEAATGGGSDGSFTSALGIPTLDGMGAVGGGAHAYDEHVLIKFIPERTALLAAMLL